MPRIMKSVCPQLKRTSPNFGVFVHGLPMFQVKDRDGRRAVRLLVDVISNKEHAALGGHSAVASDEQTSGLGLCGDTGWGFHSGSAGDPLQLRASPTGSSVRITTN